MKRRIAIIGGGIMGVTLAYKLIQEDMDVTVFERSPSLGGLANFIDYNGVRIDRFYHTILSSDMSMQNLINETGIADRLHFTQTKQGFYDDGKMYPFNTPLDFMRFPPLNIFQRFRLGLQVIYAQFEKDWRKMEDVPVKDWLIKVSGRGVYEKVWEPLLRAKFDTAAVDIAATYIWSRLRRMMETRQGATSVEMMCYLEGGYYALIEAMAEQAEALGVEFRTNCAIDEIIIEDNRATGVRIGYQEHGFDAVISTLQSPIFSRLIPDAPEDYQQQLAEQAYLSVLCPLVIMNRSLIPYYVLNITDKSIPFTAIVETTNLIDPKHVGGHHLIYLPKYLAPDSELFGWSDEKVREVWMQHLKRMFPDFQETWITDFLVQRARYVEPLRPMGTTDQIPSVQTPVEQLYLSNTVMLYPDLNNGEAVTLFAQKVVRQVLEDAPLWQSNLARVMV